MVFEKRFVFSRLFLRGGYQSTSLAGHLYSAMAELETLEGRPRAVAQDWINVLTTFFDIQDSERIWIQEAKERLIIDQTVMLIRAHIGSLVAALC